MLSDETRQQLQHIIRGTIIESHGDSCRAVRNYLCAGFGTSRTAKKDFQSKSLIKEKQASELRRYANENDCWIAHLPSGWLYLTHGGEARVYLDASLEGIKSDIRF
jgi:hypothetical protein